MTTTESPLAAAGAPPPLPAADAPPRPPRVWRFWGTLIWSVLIYGATAIGATIGILLAVYWFHVDFALAARDRAAFLNDGLIVSTSSLSGGLVALAVLALAVRLARQRFADYLALRWPSIAHAGIGLGATVLVMILIDGVTALIGRPIAADVMLAQVRSASEHGALGFFALVLIVTAPITEEIIFRGFIYRGLSSSRLGRWGAVALSSLIFTAIHIQYDLYVLSGVLVLALLLGTMRAISGSTLLTIAMHALNNFAVLVEMMWFAGMLGR